MRLRSTLALAALLAAVPFARCQVTAQPPTDVIGGGPAGDIKTREDRIRYHQERVKAMLDTRRAAEMEAAKKAEEAAKAASKPIMPMPTPKVLPTPPPGITPPVAAPPEPKVEDKPPVASESQSQMQIDPPSQTVLVGSVFDTRVSVLNDLFAKMDDVEICLKYPPEALSLLEVSDENVRKHTTSAPVYENNPTSGTLYYRNKITAPYPFKNEPLLQLRWKALIPLASVRLGFVQNAPDDGARTTALRCFGVDQLGAKENTLDGTIDGQITIDLPEKSKARPIFSNASQPIKGGIKVKMRSDTPWSRVGKQFVVTVSIENPACLFMDTVKVRMWYDPAALEVVDWDRGNWIRRGINAQDAFAHRDFPFAFHRANEADNLMGEFEYEMGMADRFVAPSADLFKIRFRALSVRTENLVCFDITPAKEGLGVALLSQGNNVLDYNALLKYDDIILNVPILPALQEEAALEENTAGLEKPASLEKPAGLDRPAKQEKPELPRSSYNGVSARSKMIP